MSSNELEGQLVRTHDDTRRFKLIRISTKEITNGTPYNFVVELGNDFRLDSSIEIHLLSAAIPNIANNVSADIGNNKFSLSFSTSGVITITLPDGFYNIAEVIANIEAQINPIIAPTVLTITQDAITNKLTFSVVGPQTFTWTGSSFVSMLATYLGGPQFSAGPLTTYTLPMIPSLYGATMFFIHSQELGPELTYLQTDGSNSVNSVNGIFSIPINVVYGDIQTYSAIEQDRVVFGRVGRSTRNFHITLRVNGGRLFTELTTNQEAIINLKVLWNSSMN